MALRRRLGLVAAAAVAVAVVLAAFVCYFVVRGQLRGQVDDALKAQATLVRHVPDYQIGGGNFPGLSANLGGRAPYTQVVDIAGGTRVPSVGLALPVDASTRAVAPGLQESSFEDVSVGDSPLRMFVFHVNASINGGPVEPLAIQLARPLGPVNHILNHLRLILLLLCAGGIALAALLSRLAANRVLAPLAEVTQTAELIGETDDLTQRLAVHADDEVGQLASRFNAMLERLQHSRSELDASVRAQRQLVADASHELRTPVTSLRTNVEVLLEGGELGEEDRRRLLADVVEQSEELTALVADLIELARGDLPAESTEDVRLDGIVEEAVARAHRNSPDIEIKGTLTPVIVEGAPERLSRAVNNLLDNAARHSPPGGPIEVAVDADGLRVRDHGSGVEEADLPYVFDRFYRGANSRGRQGSGLGLAIVRQVAEQHGGTVNAANHQDGGAVFTIRLPTTIPDQGMAAKPAHPIRVSVS